MKRNMLSMLTVAAAALLLMGAGRDEGGGHGGGGRSHSTVYRRQRVSVPRASMPSRVVHDQNRAVYPQRNETGARITKHASTVPPAHHAAVVRNAGLVRNIQAQQRMEMVPNHYYWHNDNGMRYSHYYDGHNHWYGFYHGPTFYWTRYYGNRWWWFDGPHARWDFWWDGFWWWPGAGGVPYVYVDNNYYPYEDSGVTVEHAEDEPAPASIPAPASAGTKVSPDGRRMVQMGADGQAFLYDKTKSPPMFMKYLGQGVSGVRYSGGTSGAPLQIMVEYNDGTFALFDADGNSQSSAVESTESAAPAAPETPDSIPPPPTSAPGQ